MRIFFKLLIFCVCFLITERLCHKATEGFQIHKILSDSGFDPKWETGSFNPDLDRVFDQTFYFLGRGGQCYAFVSNDKKYVIKFFKQHHMRKLPWLENVALPSFLNKYRNKILFDRSKRSQDRIFGSYKIAYDYLKEQTALLYLHLNKTESFHKKITIVDRLGIQHLIDLDTTEFALQKYATLTYPHLRNLIRENKIEDVKECLSSLAQLLITRTHHGIIDHDTAFQKNFGFIENTAIEIDLGSFSFATEGIDPKQYQEALFIETFKLKKWLAKRCPQLVEYFNAQLYETFRHN